MTCRICKTPNLEDVIDLGDQVITSRFPVYGDHTTPTTHICLAQCRDCGLVQLKDLVSGDELYEHLYGYRSGLNEMMRRHLRDYNSEVQKIAQLQRDDVVLDIGSNDATFLSYYPAGVRRVGCDPTGKQFASYYTGMELVPTYFTASAVPNCRYKIVSSISMFYDLPDPVQFARDIHACLADDGIWTFEQSYILTMLERNSIDTICHEHVEYYAVKQVKKILDLAGFVIVKISLNDCNGGSFRIYAAKRGSVHPEDTETVARFLENELKYGLDDPATYRAFVARCDEEVRKLKQFLRENPSTYIYGASTKGNCLLQYAKIGELDIRYAVERNLDKVGKMTSTGIPIISEETMRKDPPKNLLVLPWHFRDMIIEREGEFIKSGGRLAFPFPRFHVVENQMKLEGHASQDAFPRYVLFKNSNSPKTFLDIGAYVPQDGNNTYTLEKEGWTGLAVDIRDLGHLWKAQRTTPFLSADAITLDWNSVLSKHFGDTHVIDYLSFDVDDATRPTFKNFPFDNYTFRTITIEHDAYRVGNGLRDDLRSRLTSLGYVLICANVVMENHGPFEDWWVHPDHVDMAWAERVKCSDVHHRTIFNSMDYLMATSA